MQLRLHSIAQDCIPFRQARINCIATNANELMAQVHTRMPVILHPTDYDRWLERDSDRAPVDLLRPFEAEAMAAAPCNPKVGNVRNNGLEMLNSA